MANVSVFLTTCFLACFFVQVSCFLPFDWHAHDPMDESSVPFKIQRLDHYVIIVEDMNKTVDFYTRVLGMEAVPLGARIALHFGESKINVHQRGREVQPTASVTLPGSSDVCLVTDTNIRQVVNHLKKMDVSIIMGPIFTSGAIGTIQSVYFKDPDGNLIEIANYRHNMKP